jgi:hypothetical protein
MPLKLLAAKPGDLPRIVQLENDSFADSPLTPILFPNGRSPEAQAAYVETLLQQWHDNSSSRHAIVVDSDLNDEIIAFARWFMYIGDDVKYIKTEPGQRGNTPGCNEEAMNEFFDGMMNLRLRILGKSPHCCRFNFGALSALSRLTLFSSQRSMH